jgi:hypothetical protein
VGCVDGDGQGTGVPVAMPGARAGEAEGGDHVAARALAASPWLRTVFGVISRM